MKRNMGKSTFGLSVQYRLALYLKDESNNPHDQTLAF